MNESFNKLGESLMFTKCCVGGYNVVIESQLYYNTVRSKQYDVKIPICLSNLTYKCQTTDQSSN